MLQLIGLPEITATLGKRGWSQGGGSGIGNFTLEILPRQEGERVALPAFRLAPQSNDAEPAKAVHLKAIFIAPSSCHAHFRTVLIPAIRHHFGSHFEANANPDITCEGSLHEKRMYFILIATMPESPHKLARDWLYDRKIRTHERAATDMVEAVTNALANEVESGAYVDEHLRDQLIIFQALANGKSEVYPGVDLDEDRALREPSLHARTAEWIAKKMLGVTFDAEGSCEGVGLGAGEDEVVDGDEQLERGLDGLKID